MEKTVRTLALVLAMGTFAPGASAQPFGTATINPAPTIGAGSITAQGTYTVQNGWAPTIKTYLYAVPMDGGLLNGKQVDAAPACNKWGPLTITNLAPGQYAVYLGMQLQDSSCPPQQDLICSKVSVIDVVDKGGDPDPVPGVVSFAAGDPGVAAGTVLMNKNGTYTAQCGYTGTACVLAVVPRAGGDIPAAFQKTGPAPTATNWGPITINKLPSGSYLVYGSVTMSKGTAKVPVLTIGNIMYVP